MPAEHLQRLAAAGVLPPRLLALIMAFQSVQSAGDDSSDDNKNDDDSSSDDTAVNAGDAGGAGGL